MERIGTHQWADELLAPYGHMLTVTEIAHILKVEPRVVRELLTHEDPTKRLPGFKLSKTWRIARLEFRQYLLATHNGSIAGNSSTFEQGNS